MTALVSSTQVLGARLLREIGDEEDSLEDLLLSLRQTLLPQTPETGIPALSTLWTTHNPSTPLKLTHRALPLLHTLLTTLLSAPDSKTITLLDLTHRFTPSHLLSPLTTADLAHLHIFHPHASNLASTLASLETYMLEGAHASKGREWWGTIVIGGTGGKVDVGWRGWMSVQREETAGFAWGVSVEEALGGREERAVVCEGRGWRGVVDGRGGRGGEFVFGRGD